MGVHIIPYSDAAALAAIGGQLAYGSYAGDNTTNRQITVGFRCKYVFIGEVGAFKEVWTVYGSLHSLLCAESDRIWDEGTRVKLHATDGFIISYSSIFEGSQGANMSGRSYAYIASG